MFRSLIQTTKTKYKLVGQNTVKSTNQYASYVTSTRKMNVAKLTDGFQNLT